MKLNNFQIKSAIYKKKLKGSTIDNDDKKGTKDTVGKDVTEARDSAKDKQDAKDKDAERYSIILLPEWIYEMNLEKIVFCL